MDAQDLPETYQEMLETVPDSSEYEGPEDLAVRYYRAMITWRRVAESWQRIAEEQMEENRLRRKPYP